jgi:hypothetical protein
MTRDFRFDRVDDTDSRLVWAYREIDLVCKNDFREALDCNQPRLVDVG